MQNRSDTGALSGFTAAVTPPAAATVTVVNAAAVAEAVAVAGV